MSFPSKEAKQAAVSKLEAEHKAFQLESKTICQEKFPTAAGIGRPKSRLDNIVERKEFELAALKEAQGAEFVAWVAERDAALKAIDDKIKEARNAKVG